MAVHPQGECLQAADREPGGERVRGDPEVHRAFPERPVRLVACGDDQPERDVVVAAQVLGGGVDHDVGTVLDRPAQQRRGEGVVHHARQPRRAAGLQQRGLVAHGDRGVGDRLQEQQPGPRPERSGQLRRVPPGDVTDIDAMTGGQAGEDGKRAAVQAPLRADMVAGAKQGKQHRIDGAHAGAGRDRRRPPFQIGGRVLQRAGGGVPVPAVGEPGVGIVEGFRARLRVGECEGRGLVDRDADRAGAVQLGRGGMDGAGFQVQVHGTDSANAPGYWARCGGKTAGADALATRPPCAGSGGR